MKWLRIISSNWWARAPGDTVAGMGKRAKLTVGTKVRLRFGERHVLGTVVEDRGPLGANGVQIVRIRVRLSYIDETVDLEVAATDVKKVAA